MEYEHGDYPVKVSAKENAANGIILLRTPPGRTKAVGLINHMESEARIRYLPGFRGASFMFQIGGSHVLEYVQWDDISCLRAVAANPLYREHIDVVNEVHGHNKNACFYDCVKILRREDVADEFGIAGYDGHPVGAIIASAQRKDAEKIISLLESQIAALMPSHAFWQHAALHRAIEANDPLLQDPDRTQIAAIFRFEPGSEGKACQDIANAIRDAASQNTAIDIDVCEVFLPYGSTGPDPFGLTPLQFSMTPSKPAN